MITLFLNVNGVLNCETSESIAPDGSRGIDNDKVKILRDIIKQTNAVLVLAAPEWIADYRMETERGLYLTKKLDRQGVHITECTNNIEKYIMEKPWAKPYVVLDVIKNDEDPSYIAVDPDTGLTEFYVQPCVNILSKYKD